MKRLTLIAPIIFSLLPAAPAFAAQFDVRMLNQGTDGVMVFEPAYLHVQPGDTITFKAVDAAHNSASVLIPAGAAAWNSAMGETFSITLTQPGVYLYKCTPHLVLGMVGVIQVGEAVNLDAAQAKAGALTHAIAVNAQRVDAYLSQIR